MDPRARRSGWWRRRGPRQDARRPHRRTAFDIQSSWPAAVRVAIPNPQSLIPNPKSLHQRDLFRVWLRTALPGFAEVRYASPIAGWPSARPWRARARVRERRDPIEHRAPRPRRPRAHERRDVAMQLLDPRVGVRPAIGQRGRIESADLSAEVLELQQP